MQKVVAKQRQALLFLLLIAIVIIVCLLGTGWYLFKTNLPEADKNARSIAELWNLRRFIAV